MKRSNAQFRQHGFTLIEVLVSILLVSIGIFGFAKTQALALSSTQIASSRSIVSVQASSLAALMHGNRTFWAAGVAPANFSLSGSTVTDSTGVLTAAVTTCVASTVPATALCTPAQLAAWDLQQWAVHMADLLPSYTAAASCTTTTNAPVNCVLTVSWTEKYVSATRTAALDSAATGGTRSYTLYIEP